MAEYMKVSGQIYSVYLRDVAPEDIFAYSVDEVFIDATYYLKTYKLLLCLQVESPRGGAFLQYFKTCRAAILTVRSASQPRFFRRTTAAASAESASAPTAITEASDV